MSFLSPYCAEFELAATDGRVITIWPRRPVGELTGPRLRKMIPATALRFGIALYDNNDADLYEYRRWLEEMLGYNLVMKKRPSQHYKKLSDCILLPCPGPRVFDLASFRMLGGGR